MPLHAPIVSSSPLALAAVLPALALALAGAVGSGPAAAQTVSGASGAASAAPLSLKVYNADAGSFHVNAVLVSGQTDAVLLDTGFTRADALRIAAMVLDSRKTLKTIYISQADPDFYFGIAVLKQFFPQAQVVATAPTLKKIQATLANKLQVWGPRMGPNAPASVPLPEALTENLIRLEGQSLEIRGADDSLAHRSYVWIPSIRAIAGGVNVFGGLHVWTADTPSVPERADWGRKLAGMAALTPLTVVPGHSAAGAKHDASTIGWTQDYLARFEQELPKAAQSAALIDAMKAAYPAAGLGIALDIGAKVTKGEMKW